MSISVDWGNHEETLIIWKFVQEWNTVDIIRAIDATYTLLSLKPIAVNIILDMRHSKKRNQRISSLQRAFNRVFPTNLQKVIILSNSLYWQQFFQLVDQLLDDDKKQDFDYTSDVNMAYSLSGFEADIQENRQ